MSMVDQQRSVTGITSYLTGRRCQCGNCGEQFQSGAAFAKHRVDDPNSPTGRACMDELEMVEAGMVCNLAGYWVSKSWPEPGFGGDEDVPDPVPPEITELLPLEMPVSDEEIEM